MPRPTNFQWEIAINEAVEWVNQPHRAPLMDELNRDHPGTAAKAMRRMANILNANPDAWAPFVFAWRFEAYRRERAAAKRKGFEKFAKQVGGFPTGLLATAKAT